MKINSYVLSLALLATPNHPAFVSAQEPCPYGDGNFEAITAFNHGQYYDLPACATSCVGGAQGGIGCSNANCACSNLNQYWSYVSSCIDESCTPSAAMLSNALQLVAPFCNSVGGCYGFTPPAVTSMSTTFSTATSATPSVTPGPKSSTLVQSPTTSSAASPTVTSDPNPHSGSIWDIIGPIAGIVGAALTGVGVWLAWKQLKKR